MQQELLAQVNEAGIPEALKVALADLVQAVDAALPQFPGSERWRARHWLKRTVAEAIDPASDSHWWTANLDLLARTARACGPAGGPVVAASARLAPLMEPHMRPGLPGADEITLREITAETVFGICDLSDTLTEPRKAFVAPNAISLAEALFSKHAWYRAIYAGKDVVGFMMLEDNPELPEYFLWRFMIAGPYQGRGYGSRAIARLVEHVKGRPGATELTVSCGEGEGSPKGFYLKQGFVPTGEILDEETVLRLTL